MEVQNISGPDVVARTFSTQVESVPEQSRAQEQERRESRPVEESKGNAVDYYA